MRTGRELSAGLPRIRYHGIDEFHIVLGAVRSAGSTNVHESSTSMWHPA